MDTVLHPNRVVCTVHLFACRTQHIVRVAACEIEDDQQYLHHPIRRIRLPASPAAKQYHRTCQHHLLFRSLQHLPTKQRGVAYLLFLPANRPLFTHISQDTFHGTCVLDMPNTPQVVLLQGFLGEYRRIVNTLLVPLFLLAGADGWTTTVLSAFPTTGHYPDARLLSSQPATMDDVWIHVLGFPVRLFQLPVDYMKDKDLHELEKPKEANHNYLWRLPELLLCLINLQP